MIKKIIAYTKRDIVIEWKNKSILISSIVYLFAVVYICVQAFKFIEPDAWNALFWIVSFFVILTITGRSFQSESENRFAYHYHLVKPEVIIWSKLLLNGIFSLFISLIAYIAFAIFLGSDLQQPGIFLLVLVLGSLGIAFTFTLTSALSARAGGNLVLTSILSLPLILPLLLIVIDLTEFCFTNNDLSTRLSQFLGLGLLNLIILVLSSLLFPYLWRD